MAGRKSDRAVADKQAQIDIRALKRQGHIEPGAEQVVLRIVDNGRGMPREQLARIFEPFYTTRSNGTGLGLAVVQSVVHAHQGTVEVASVEGEGSCFTLRLPCHQAAGRLQASGGAV